MRTIELLAPAKDASCAIAAIKCGADAVYIGPPKFGARKAVPNSIEDIKKVTDFAHQFYSKVYVALNTLLTDEEMLKAEKIIHQLYKTGIDGLIIQDMGICELELPPLPLIASTQMDNSKVEKIKFLEDIGFSRVILARELTLEQIRNIRKNTTIELECFVHGALCVSASGNCYMSYALGGRSGNRGECAQPCRKIYNLKNNKGDTLIKNKHLLSLKDLNLSDYLEKLIEAGICSFKIEGRLKDESYVANITGYYRQKLDKILAEKNMQASSSGKVNLGISPDPEKTFCRGFTNYGIDGSNCKLAAIKSPKSIGQYIGKVENTSKESFTVNSDIQLHNADGICFFDKNDDLCGTVINKVENNKIIPQNMENITVGTKIYRNLDHAFLKQLKNLNAERKIDISLTMKDTENSITLTAKDEDGNSAVIEKDFEKNTAIKKDSAMETINRQLKKLGNTIFNCKNLEIKTKDTYFFPVSLLNELKRTVVEELLNVRKKNRFIQKGQILKNNIAYPQKNLDHTGNVLNNKAKQFYERHCVKSILPAVESGKIDMSDKIVMSTKYCIAGESGLCNSISKQQGESFYLQDQQGNIFELIFKCPDCGMEIKYIKKI